RRVRRDRQGFEVLSSGGSERLDMVVFACHREQALALLDAPSEDEHAVIGALRYASKEVVLHTDTCLLPRRMIAWASWN
ncbi:FAD-dependent oxidoreductase, partial [Pseudomonas sp. Pseusp97]